jgi:hypothetical protein
MEYLKEKLERKSDNSRMKYEEKVKYLIRAY